MLFYKNWKANTLIEMIVVLIIMLALSAIAFANFSKTKDNSSDTIAKGNLARAIEIQNSYRVEFGNFTSSIQNLVKDNTLVFTNEVSYSDTQVSVYTDKDGNLYLANLSKSGTCFGKKVSQVSGEEKIEDISLDANESCSAQSFYNR